MASTSKDEAVSPVIAVILMVAITVVLAAVVYVWVSGMGEGSEMARSLSLQSSGSDASGANFTVISATPGLPWNELRFLVDGEAANVTMPSGTVNAGDVFRVNGSGLSGKTLSVVDAPSNSVVISLRFR